MLCFRSLRMIAHPGPSARTSAMAWRQDQHVVWSTFSANSYQQQYTRSRAVPMVADRSTRLCGGVSSTHIRSAQCATMPLRSNCARVPRKIFNNRSSCAVHHVSPRYALYTPLILVCRNSQVVIFQQCPAFLYSLSVLLCPQHPRHRSTSLSRSHKNKGWIL